MWVKNTRGKKIVLNFYFSWTVNPNKYAVLTTLSSILLRTKEKTVKKSEIWVKFLTIGSVFYPVGDWDDPQIDPHVKIQFAGIVPVFLEFNAIGVPTRGLRSNFLGWDLHTWSNLLWLPSSSSREKTLNEYLW